MRIIFKSMIGHWKKSIGLTIELIIVTVIGWILIDPVAMMTSMVSIPSNYDYDRLVTAKFSTLDINTYDYDSTANENQSVYYQRILDLIRQHPEVEYATFCGSLGFESDSYWGVGFPADSTFYDLDAQDIEISTTYISYVPGTDYFATYGIKDPDGNPFVEPENDGTGYIVTQTLAKGKYPVKSAIGQNLFELTEEVTAPTPILGITADTPYRKSQGRTAVAFYPCKLNENSVNGITIRVKDGVNPRRFLDDLTTQISIYKIGNIYLSEPELMADKREKTMDHIDKKLTQNWVMVIFFIVNVILGIAGTFYIQCRSRISDAGVMRAFGASRRRIEWSIIGEACITVILAWLIGSAIYFIYLHFSDIEIDTEVGKAIQMIKPMWYDTALSRYTIIGGSVLILLLISAIIGVCLPARRVGRVAIVDSLRDE